MDYFIMFLFICISGNPVFIYTKFKYIYIFFALVVTLICVIKKKALYKQKLLRWFLGFIVLFSLQYLCLEIVSVPADINFFARFYTAFLIASLYGSLFRHTYFKVIVFICVISLICYTINTIGGINFGVSFDRYKTILIYNQELHFKGDIRNCGLFWEPGAFQGFIMLVPLFYIDKLKMLWDKHKLSCLILIVTLLTTKSTAGYLTLAVFLFLLIISNNRINFAKKVFIVSLAVICFVFLVWELDFIGEKFVKQFEDFQNLEEGEVSWDRMGAMKVDIFNILRHPFIGNGFDSVSKYGILAEFMGGAGNGLSGATNILGIPCVILYFIGIYKNFRGVRKAHGLIIVFIVAMLLFNEAFLNYSLFWALLFINIPHNDEESCRIINCS